MSLSPGGSQQGLQFKIRGKIGIYSRGIEPVRSPTFLQGYPSEEKDKKKKPYALPHTHSLHASTFETAVARISYKRYLQKTTDFETARVQPGYYATTNQANPIHATPEMEQIEPRDSVTEQGTEQGSETIVHSKCALSPHMLVITAPSVKPRGFDCPLRL